MRLKKYTTATEASAALIEHLITLMDEDKEKQYHMAFSGGSTPALMFDLWANDYKDATDWSRLNVYWVDERCVAPEDSDSNYGLMKKLLLDRVPLSEDQVHRMRGEDDPEQEAKRYTQITLDKMPHVKGYPEFDVVLLGAGDDGHTSSIFPGQEELLISPDPFVKSVNPYNGQNRIAMTGQTITHARLIIFLITGEKKAEVVADIYSSGDTGPAAYMAHHSSNVEIFIDEQAAQNL